MLELARRLTAGVVAIAIFALAPAVRAQDGPTVSRGSAPAGYALAVAPASGAPRILCEPSCELTLPAGEVRVGWRRGAREIEWQRSFLLEHDARLDVRYEDYSAVRGLAYGLLIVGALLLAASAIVGIATEPDAPEVGWFGDRHGLVFAGIAGGIVLAFGVTGVGLALAFARDQPTLDVVTAE